MYFINKGISFHRQNYKYVLNECYCKVSGNLAFACFFFFMVVLYSSLLGNI